MVEVLRVSGLSKSFPGVQALDRLDFSGEAGTVHAVLGENGAGKSTLIKALGGTLKPDAGSIALFGKSVEIRSVTESRRLGVSVAYQELSLVPDLTVGQNIWLNRSGLRELGVLSRRELKRRTEALYEWVKAPPVDPRRAIKDLSIAARHVVEIVASVASNPKILVLDEATAALPAREAEWALGLARDMAAGGALVLFISHRLHECRDVAEHYTVLRRGRAIRSGRLREASDEAIVEDMLGRKPRMLYPPQRRTPAPEAILSVSGLSVAHELSDVSFDLRAGEILGLGGLEGQGQSTLMLALFGIKRWSGTVRVDGVPVRIDSPRDALAAGISLVPEDRRYQGLHLDKSIRENIALPVLSRLSRFGFLAPGVDRPLVRALVGELGIGASSIEQAARTLSGGNQQKVVIAKLLATGGRILLFHDLTRGIDIGTKAEIFHLARRLAEEGRAILFYSSENLELVNMCDRILVLRQSRLATILTGSERTEERALQAAMGAPAASAAA